MLKQVDILATVMLLRCVGKGGERGGRGVWGTGRRGRCSMHLQEECTEECTQGCMAARAVAAFVAFVTMIRVNTG